MHTDSVVKTVWYKYTTDWISCELNRTSCSMSGAGNNANSALTFSQVLLKSVYFLN